jgi:hypothetical protein
LKFNRPFEKYRSRENSLMRDEKPLLKRLLTKVVHDVLPAALASVIGGFLFTHFQLGRVPEPVAAQVVPASAEMMQLLRDEHGLIVSFVQARIADEKKQLTANESAPSGAAEPQPAAAVGASRPSVVAMAAAKSNTPRGKPAFAGGSLPPLLIAQVRHDEASKSVAREQDSLLAKTIGIKDHVVAVTQRVVSAIGGIPTWIGAIGDRIGGEDQSLRPPANLVSAS